MAFKQACKCNGHHRHGGKTFTLESGVHLAPHGFDPVCLSCGKRWNHTPSYRVSFVMTPMEPPVWDGVVKDRDYDLSQPPPATHGYSAADIALKEQADDDHTKHIAIQSSLYRTLAEERAVEQHGELIRSQIDGTIRQPPVNYAKTPVKEPSFFSRFLKRKGEK